MDTDELSKEAYASVIIEAERFHHDLTLQFGLLSYGCGNEKEYLDKAVKVINKLKKISKHGLDQIFFDEIPEISAFHHALDTILINIEQVNQIPENKRHYDF